MTTPRRSLARSLTRPLLILCTLAVVAGTILSAWAARREYDELLDISIRTRAELILPLVSRQIDTPTPDMAAYLSGISDAGGHEDDRSNYWLLDLSGQVVWRSADTPPGFAPPGIVPPDGLQSGYVSTAGHRFFTSAPDSLGRRIVVANPLAESKEAQHDVISSILLSLGLLVIITFLLMRRAIGQVQGSVVALSREIARRNETNLQPIDPANTYLEFASAIGTLNALMARLDKAVEAERSFATNAAHELRTPLAVSLAHTQRLRAAGPGADIGKRAAEIEKGLKRLIHLVERLLQFSRAQSGLGKAAAITDASIAVRLVFDEAAQQRAGRAVILTHPPTGPCPSPIDPDALAILLSNLIDNAVKYSDGPDPVELDARQPRRITISNDCTALTPQDLARITERHVRRSSGMDGYGIGLSIVKTLCEQSGARVVFASPRNGSDRGFCATLHLPD